MIGVTSRHRSRRRGPSAWGLAVPGPFRAAGAPRRWGGGAAVARSRRR